MLDIITIGSATRDAFELPRLHIIKVWKEYRSIEIEKPKKYR